MRIRFAVVGCANERLDRARRIARRRRTGRRRTCARARGSRTAPGSARGRAFFAHLLARLRDDDALAAARAISRSSRPRLPAGRRLERHHARGVLEDAQRHRLVDQAHALGAPRVDRLAGEEHVERGRRADELRQPLHAVPGRHDAEHHLGQREARLRVVERDAVAAGERELDAAAHAEAVHHRGGGEGQLVQLWNTSQPSRTNASASCGDLKRVNSSTSAPAMKLSFAERMTRPFGRSARDRVERAAQLFERLARERVGRLALLVEGEPGEAVAVVLPAPMLREDLRCRSRSMAPLRALPPASRRRGRRRCRCEAMPRFLPLLRFSVFKQMQDDARARGAHRMAERDRAAVDVELFFDRARPARRRGRAARGSTSRPSTPRGSRAPARRRPR